MSDDPDVVDKVESLVDLYEVRIDLIGDGWRKVAEHLGKPWIACNRKSDEGGMWMGSEGERVTVLLSALELGADMIDIELSTENLKDIVPEIKKQAQCLLSFHDLAKTPPLHKMKEIVQKQLTAGADICKVVATAQKFEDNLRPLQLIQEFPEAKVVSFAMGSLGFISRFLCPLVGGEFIYAAIEPGREAASGQITASQLREMYGMLKV